MDEANRSQWMESGSDLAAETDEDAMRHVGIVALQSFKDRSRSTASRSRGVDTVRLKRT